MTIGDDGIATRDGTTGKPRCDECGAYDYEQHGHYNRCSQRQPATTYELTVAEQPRTERPASAAGSECGFNEAWIGKCKQTGNPRCSKHEGKVCTSCGADATRNCPETGQFVCGADLCDECEHTTFSDGTNGGIGFNAQSLPEGMKSHCRKVEQRFQPWYMRDGPQPPAPAAQETGEWRYIETAYSAEVHTGQLVIRPHWTGTADATNIRATMKQIVNDHNERQSLSAERERLRAALRDLRAMFFEDARSGANVVDGKLEFADKELHPWIPGARAPRAIAIIDAALNEQGKESG